MLEGKVIHIEDMEADLDYTFAPGRQVGFRTLLGVPMLRDGVPAGVLTLMRTTMRPFTEQQIELVTTFADQAAIAIENVRLFEAEQQRTRELRQRTDDLPVSEQQTATSKVLEVISRSAFDLHAVFETVVESSVRLCGADRAIIYRFDGRAAADGSGLQRVSRSEEEVDGAKSNSTRPPRRYAPARRSNVERSTFPMSWLIRNIPRGEVM